MPTLLPQLVFRPLDPNGRTIPGGQCFSYYAGTTTMLATYGETGAANPNPTILDSTGMAHIRLAAGYSYKINLLDSLGVQIPGYPIDNIVESGGQISIAVQTIPSADNQPQLTSMSNLIPAGVRVLVVTTRIVTTFGGSRLLTSFAIGDATTIDRWGVQTVLTAGALSGGTDAPPANQARLTEMVSYPNPQPVVITALGGLFDATGSLEISVQYLATPHRVA